MAKAKPAAHGPEVPFPWSAKVKLRKGGTATRVPGRGSYLAYQIGDLVTLAATGIKPNPATQVSLVALPSFVFPPIFGLFFTQTGPGIQIPVPFHVEAHLHSPTDIKTLTVVDAAGSHKVPVTQF